MFMATFGAAQGRKAAGKAWKRGSSQRLPNDVVAQVLDLGDEARGDTAFNTSAEDDVICADVEGDVLLQGLLEVQPNADLRATFNQGSGIFWFEGREVNVVAGLLTTSGFQTVLLYGGEEGPGSAMDAVRGEVTVREV